MPILIGEGEAILEIWPCQGRGQCSSPGCRFLARIVLVRVIPSETGGRSHYCFKHTRKLLVQAEAHGIAICDMRGLKAPKAPLRR
jgi:hypothetical protein